MPLREIAQETSTAFRRFQGNDDRRRHTVCNAYYFESLDDLDTWAQTSLPESSDCGKPAVSHSPISYVPRTLVAQPTTSLMVCHDYKGGYSEIVNPHAFSYTFNHWQFCDTFIYFSHYRVSTPPTGWISAAHRQGVRVLGTLMFEHKESQSDCHRLLHGPPALSRNTVSSHYASILARLAGERGFDGYLLNFECELPARQGGDGQQEAQILRAWISLLREQLKLHVGDHAEVVWYDSVLRNGKMKHQRELNDNNALFVSPSSAFFIDYRWTPKNLHSTAEYLAKLNRNPPLDFHSKTSRDIYVGIDAFERTSNFHGIPLCTNYHRPGRGCYKAMEHIDPSLSLSVALFAPAWTWERLQGDFSWETWWSHDRDFWVGSDDRPVVTPPPRSVHVTACWLCTLSMSSYKPLAHFFPRQPPPNPAQLPFFTSFSPGVGKSWFAAGKMVFTTEDGWTDVDKCCSLGDLLWPQPTPAWADGWSEPTPETRASVRMEDAWLGGSCLRLRLALGGADERSSRHLWLPIQSLVLTSETRYKATLVYKTREGCRISISVKPRLELEGQVLDVVLTDSTSTRLSEGWIRCSSDVTFVSPIKQEVEVSCGIVISWDSLSDAEITELVVDLGMLTMHTTCTETPRPTVLTARLEKAPGPYVRGTLIWETQGQPSDFAYFNIYAHPQWTGGIEPTGRQPSFCGTTGCECKANTFYFDCASLGPSYRGTIFCKLYVQGVTSQGEILPLDQCMCIDVRPPRSS